MSEFCIGGTNWDADPQRHWRVGPMHVYWNYTPGFLIGLSQYFRQTL